MDWIIFLLVLLIGWLGCYHLAKSIANKIDKWVKNVVREWNE